MKNACSLGTPSSGLPTNKRAGIVAIILCLFCAGCVHYRTPAERDTSFSPYKDVKIGPESLRKYLIARSAVLLEADLVNTSSISSNSVHIANTNAWLGTATAIDTRGYFLTAAHCVKNPKRVWLAFLRAGQLQVECARIVWRGDKTKHDPDLAILCISQPIDRSFEWATEATNGTPILDVGMTCNAQTQVLKTQCMAGKILKISDHGKNTTYPYRVVAHDSPLIRGDSGGPFVLADGRLLGINVSGEIWLKWKTLLIEPLYFEAHCPDPGWLRIKIENDAARQPGASPAMPLARPVSPPRASH